MRTLKRPPASDTIPPGKLKVVFTGIIEGTGNVVRMTRGSGAARLVIAGPPALLGQLTEGASVAVNGVCLTAIAPSPERFEADIAQETMDVTTLGTLAENAVVNLELPTRAGAPLGGHIVLGHVEGVGRIVSLEPLHRDESSDWRLRVWAPMSLAHGLVHKGSVAIDGISLTIAALTDAEREGLAAGVILDVAIIPHTYEATRLRALAAGDAVNLETDVMLRRGLSRQDTPQTVPLHKPFQLTVEYLIANGY